MSEFFLELFTEEIPSNLQKNARENILESFQSLFKIEDISFKKSFCYSTPNRLIVVFEDLVPETTKKSEEVRGPNISAPEKALEGFLRSHNIDQNITYKKKIDKGEFYFFKRTEKKIKTVDLLEERIPQILDKISWKKSMKWGEFDLKWARPLKSIMAIFDSKKLNFIFHHIQSSNITFIDKEFEEKQKNFKNFKNYNDFFKKNGILINQDIRKKFIEKELLKIAKRKNYIVEINKKLLDEVTNLAEQPNVLICKFDQKFLNIPKEILIITMQYHQKYFHVLDQKGNIINEFLVVANNKDIKGFIKSGNERVVEARLSDAQFFWKKNKSQNLVKQVTKLKTMSYFKGLGSYFDKAQRMRKLGGIISDELLISKEKVELMSSICKIDLMSDLVNEFPELQGIMGSYFAEAQQFDKDIVLAISEQYLPVGLDSKIPKKPFSIVLALSDKLDTLIGFFGLNKKPTSSKDPYALRRLALGFVRILIENNKKFKIRDLINYSLQLYQEQGFVFKNKSASNELIDFLMERLKYYMKEKNIRIDIIEANQKSLRIDNLTIAYKKSEILNKFIDKDIGINIISSYKRAFNILESELKNTEIELSSTTDPGLFKNEYEKNLYKIICQLRKYFTDVNKNENYELTLENLADTKQVIFDFFDNVKVNDEDKKIKKNRLELLQMLCKTFDKYINFSNIESSK